MEKKKKIKGRKNRTLTSILNNKGIDYSQLIRSIPDKQKRMEYIDNMIKALEKDIKNGQEKE